MDTLSQNTKFTLRLGLYFLILFYFESIPHELGHAIAAKLLGFRIVSINLSPFNPNIVSMNLSNDPALFTLMLLCGGWGVSICMYALYRLGRDLALRKIARVFILYGFLVGIFEALFTHVYNALPVFSQLLLVFCITVVFAYDDLLNHFNSGVSRSSIS